MNKFLLFSTVLFTSLLVSCDDETGNVSEKTKLLTAKSWKETKREAGAPGQPLEDITETMAECDKDNLLRFKTDGKYDEIVGSNLCYSFEENSSGTWSWEDNENKLEITNSNNLTETFTILEISSTLLKLKLPGTNEDLVLTYSGQ